MAKASSETAQRLAREVADGGPGAARGPELAGWITGSPRFASFVETHRAKIRKKLRNAGDEAVVRDVRAELCIARLLLADRRFELAFEAYGRAGGPDFTVTFRQGRAFNLEVTRLRRAPDETAIAGVVLGKLHQLPPSVGNLLLIGVEDGRAGDVDVAAVIRALRARADAKDEPFFAFRGIDGPRAFYERLLRLAGVVLWSETASGEERAAVWVNGSARISVPEATVRALLACLRA